MNYEDLTLKQINEIKNMGSCQSTFLEVGKAYFFRTVTYHYIGIVVALNDNEVKLGQASWIGDSGRWNNALVTGELMDVEPYVDGVVLKQAAIVDYTSWNHEPPTEVK